MLKEKKKEFENKIDGASFDTSVQIVDGNVEVVLIGDYFTVDYSFGDEDDVWYQISVLRQNWPEHIEETLFDYSEKRLRKFLEKHVEDREWHLDDATLKHMGSALIRSSEMDSDLEFDEVKKLFKQAEEKLSWAEERYNEIRTEMNKTFFGSSYE